MPKVSKNLLRAFYRLFYLQFGDLSDEWKRSVRFYYMKIILTITPTDLV